MAGKSKKRKAEAVAVTSEAAPNVPAQAIAETSEPERKKKKKEKKNKKAKKEKSPRDRSPSPVPRASSSSDKKKKKVKKNKSSKKDKSEKTTKASAAAKPKSSNFSPVPVADPTDDPFTTKRSWVDWSKADFGQNAARKDKFLRLLGAKKPNATNDSTLVPSTTSGNGAPQSDTATSMLSRGHVRQVEHNLEQQFSKGIQQRKQAMRGRKSGLGFGG
ncbi:hypothetical protein H4R34_002010 [Dimargaris verticillata]|uniref:Small acidic protein n=1 Tax=Dimargaris verticillata TaxID=2761393 RepID=A0A9W8EEG6_9FUNG|nr:hypothetical protein H4R34_002010 [Dimargaris verticillata]